MPDSSNKYKRLYYPVFPTQLILFITGTHFVYDYSFNKRYIYIMALPKLNLSENI